MKTQASTKDRVLEVWDLCMLLGTNKSGQLSEIFWTSRRSSDEVLNIWKSWKMVSMHLQGRIRQWGSDPDTVPQHVTHTVHGLMFVLTCSPVRLDEKSLCRATVKLPAVVLWQISTKEM